MKVSPLRLVHDANNPLATGGGGGDSGDMEQRVEQLEQGMLEVRAGLGRIEATLTKLDERGRKIEVDLAELKGRVSQLPSTIQLVGFVLAVLALAGLGRYLAG